LKTTTKAHIAVLAANFIFGANYSLAKYITPDFIKPFALNVVRVLVSVSLFWIFYLVKPSSPGIQKKHIGRFILCGACGVAINQLFFIKGLSLTTPIHASLLSLGTPIFITFIAAWLLKERLSGLRILGLLLGVLGATLLIMIKENSSVGSDVLTGDAFVAVNAISYAFYMVLVRPLMEAYSPVHVVRWVFVFGTLIILPVGWGQFADTNWQAFNLHAWLVLAFVVIGATFISYLLNIYGIQHIGAPASGSYIYTQPFFAALIAVLFYGERFNEQKAIAALLIFTGVYFVSVKRKEKSIEASGSNLE
jgi:drug/metabolite transporter (DMT)-like permease